ncbi:MAG: nickel transporter [Gammaproteobacteria bacterium]|nr:nickel transporter [Gammaproteobacteria bacterium]
MLLIPVIDLSAGQVVHAIAGKRDSYQNIQSPLCKGSCPLTVVEAMLNLYPFRVCYIADLDAIREQGDNASIISEILQRFPTLTIWLDTGKNSYLDELPTNRVRHILGSETGISSEDLAGCKARSMPILSLDFLEDSFIGQQELLDRNEQWPDKIIVMSLSHVGTDKGPDFEKILEIKKRSEHRQIFVAGGVRNEGDLQTLFNLNVAGVLLATALHSGKISHSDLEKYDPK